MRINNEYKLLILGTSGAVETGSVRSKIPLRHSAGGLLCFPFHMLLFPVSLLCAAVCLRMPCSKDAVAGLSPSPKVGKRETFGRRRQKRLEF